MNIVKHLQNSLVLLHSQKEEQPMEKVDKLLKDLRP